MVICYSDLRKPLPLNLSVDLAHLELHANSGLWPLIPQQATPALGLLAQVSPACSWLTRISLWSEKHLLLGLCLCCSTCLQLFPASAHSNLSLQIRPSLHRTPSWLYFSLHPLSRCHTHVCVVSVFPGCQPHMGKDFFLIHPHAPGTQNRNRHM